MKTRNRIFAISTAMTAMPPKPKKAATIASRKKKMAQPSMVVPFCGGAGGLWPGAVPWMAC
jgi:hypothetical protein